MTDKAIEAATIVLERILSSDTGVVVCDLITKKVIEAYEAAMWRPANEHPAHDTDLLMYDRSGGIVVGWYNNKEGSMLDGYCRWSEKHKCGVRLPNITHFRPLPTPPKE